MPFLKNFSEHFFCRPVQVEPLHQFEFTIFTSQHQYSHNLWAWFALADHTDRSPFGWLRYFLPVTPDHPAVRQLISYATAGLQFLRGRTRLVKIGHIPYATALLFTTTAKKSFIDHRPVDVETMFDVLHDFKWNYFLTEWPLCSTNNGIYVNPTLRSNDSIFAELKRRIDKDFLFAHFVTLDSTMHAHGIDAPEVHVNLANLDEGLEDFVTVLEKRVSQYNLIICSDHGMVQTRGIVDVSAIIENKNLLSFPDSTSLRIWCRSSSDYDRAHQQMRRLPHGTVCDEKTFPEIGIRYHRRYTGDLMFVADPGYIVMPNYFDGTHPPKAMHGYLPCRDLDAGFIANRPDSGHTARMRLVDICPTTLQVMGLPVPDTWQGASLL